MSVNNSLPAHTSSRVAVTGQVHSPLCPLADVTVVLTDRAGVQIGRATSGADGRFRFTDLLPETYVVIASGKGYRPSAEMIALGTGATELHIALEPSTSVRGTVHDGHTGEPVAAATVTALDPGGEVTASTVSEPDGSYLLTGIADTELTLVAAAEAADPTVTVVRPAGGDGQHHTVDIALDTHSTVTGTITAGGGAVAHLPLALRDDSGRTVATTVTDEHGTYRFDRVTAGTYTIHSPARAPQAGAVGPEATTADIALS